MEIPENTTLVVVGGSFEGTPPENFEVGGSARINGVATDASIKFQEGAKLTAGSSLVSVNGTTTFADSEVAGRMICNGGEVAVEDALNVSGYLALLNGRAFSAPSITVSGELVLSTDATTTTLTTADGSEITLYGSRLSVTTTATIAATTTFSGVGVVELPRGADRTGLEIATGASVRVVVYGAGALYHVKTTVCAASKWKIRTGRFMQTNYVGPGDAPVFMARVEYSADGTLPAPSEIDSLSYTVYRIIDYWYTEKWEPVDGHRDVELDETAWKSALVTNDPRWTEDSTGYNFAFEPDASEKPLFPEKGKYKVVVTATPTSGNPIYLTWNVVSEGTPS